MSVTPQQVREELGSPSTEDISDETLARLIEDEKTLFGAAYRAALIIARKYAFKADLAVGDYRESFSQIAERWQKLAEELCCKAAVHGGAPPYVGGIDYKKPDFWRGMFDYRDG